MHELRFSPTAAICLSGIVCTPAYVPTTMWLAARYSLSDSRSPKRLSRATTQPNLPDKAFPTESARGGVRHQCVERDQVARVPPDPRCHSATDGIRIAPGSARSHTAGTSGGAQLYRHCQDRKCESGFSP